MSYPFINTLFTNVLQKSKTIEGRFFICPQNGQEINTDTLGQLLTDAVLMLPKKYPCALMMPPRSSGTYTYNKVTWEKFRITMFWLKPSYYNENGVVDPNPNTQTSLHTIPQDWAEMKIPASDFLRILDQVVLKLGLQKDTFRVLHEDAAFAPVSTIGKDRVSGMRVDFSIEMMAGCAVIDYEPADVTALIQSLAPPAGGGGTSIGGGSGGTNSSATNWTDFTFDQLNGVFTFTGGTGDAATAIVTCLPSNITYNGAITNAEGITFTHGPFGGAACTEMTLFTPQHYHNGALESGPVVIAWRRQLAGSPYTALTPWATKELTITRLARRWYHIQREEAGQLYDLNMTWYAVGLTINLYDVAGDVIGQPNSIANLIEMWNSAPANTNFQIIDYSTIVFLRFRLEPAETEQVYPIQYVKFDYVP